METNELMEPIKIVEEIRNFCQNNADEKVIVKYGRYFKEGYDAYGVAYDFIEKKLKEILSREHFSLPLSLEVAKILIPSGKYEEMSFACSLTKNCKKEFTIETFHAIEEWFELGINNWAHTDFICGEITPYFLEKGIVDLSAFASWRTAENKFQRRAVPVSFIKPFKKGWDLFEMIDFIDPLMMDKERVVHQGLGWFLRECWKKQPETVEVFLHKWKNDAARLIFQYATEKMTKEYRLQFRKEKK